MNNIIKHYLREYILPSLGRGKGVGLLLLCGLSLTSCEDMLDKGNDYVIYAEDHVIANPADTVTNVLGILNKLQGIAVRTNLLGELRADLVTVNDNATTDIKDIASLDITDDNAYNVPRDYYAVINNCNYFLAHADSTAGNAERNQKYFDAEIAQVHSIRAWTYLQLVLAYGRVPFVTEPVLTKLQSDAQYPMYDLDQICDYFIDDLRPYYGKEYPNPVTVDIGINPKFFFYPTQVVTGDLYLWKAAKNHDAEAAKQAAKAYYDFIVWDLSGKANLRTGTRRANWRTSALTADNNYMRTDLESNLSGSYNPYQDWSKWGDNGTTIELITAIPMDSAAADGYYNQLRQLYNTQYETDFVEASISPSPVLKELSRSQTYVDRAGSDTVTVTADKFTDEQINDGYLGDLRYWANVTKRDMKWNSETIELQSIAKHSYQHTIVYRSSQIYLRLAEALNYAGYPRFARQILTMGLNNLGIQYEVSPYYTTAADSAFISYFDLNTTDFVTYALDYNVRYDSLGVAVKSVAPYLRTSTSGVNMWGIHSRGSGLAFLNSDYAPLQEVDRTGYPTEQETKVGRQPRQTDYDFPTMPDGDRYKPSTWDDLGRTAMSKEDYQALYKIADRNIERRYNSYLDSLNRYIDYLDVQLPAYVQTWDSVNTVYRTDLEAYRLRLETFTEAYTEWYNAAYGDPTFIQKEQELIDQCILDEQALELAFEGNRFYDLMRRAYWYNDNSRLATPVSRRDATVGSKLLDRSNWFLKWKGKIGL